MFDSGQLLSVMSIITQRYKWDLRGSPDLSFTDYIDTIFSILLKYLRDGLLLVNIAIY